MGSSVRLRVGGAAALFLFGIGAAAAAFSEMYGAATLVGLLALLAGIVVASDPGVARPVGQADNSVGAAEVDRLRAILDQAPTPLVLLDGEGRLEALNRAARRLFGTDLRIAAPPPGLLGILHGIRPPSVVRLAVEGIERGFAITMSRIESRESRATIAALLDVEAELRMAEMKALRELMQILSHEIMGALTPIASLSSTAAEMLADDQPDIAVARDAIETVASRATGLERFTTAYRELARLPEPRFAETNLCDLIDDAARLFQAQFDRPGVGLEIARPDDPLASSADPDQIAAAIWAMLQNAAEAALAGADRVPPRVFLAIGSCEGTVWISVRDTGNGVRPSDVDSLFRPFFTTKAGGSGIGLSLARQIARAHGGEVELAAGKDGGAHFMMELPIRAAAGPPPAGTPAEG